MYSYMNNFQNSVNISNSTTMRIISQGHSPLDDKFTFLVLLFIAVQMFLACAMRSMSIDDAKWNNKQPKITKRMFLMMIIPGIWLLYCLYVLMAPLFSSDNKIGEDI